MMRSLFSGVSGLRVHQTKMDVIANNIANVNTVGYKSSRVTFMDAFYQRLQGGAGPSEETGRAGTNPMQIGLGANVGSIDNIMTQGASQRTDNSFDAMIEGSGFFIVQDESGTYFTRAGNIKVDVQNNLHINGMPLMGWDTVKDPATGQWVIESTPVKPLNLAGEKQYMPPVSTSVIDMIGNLNPNELPPSGKVERTMTFFDSVGTAFEVGVEFTYMGANQPNSYWKYSFVTGSVNGGPVGVLAYPNGDTTKPEVLAINIMTEEDEADDAYEPPTDMANSGVLVFNNEGTLMHRLDPPPDPSGPADANGAQTYLPDDLTAVTDDDMIIGKEISIAVHPISVVDPTAIFGDTSPTGTRYEVGTAGDADATTAGIIRLNFTEFTQFDKEQNTAKILYADGNGPGTLEDYSISTDGTIRGRYSNGVTRILGQIPVATFRNPAGLEKVGNNLFVTSANSGEFDGIGSTGRIMGGALEMSNVDLSQEFTEMITTQRGFQANSRTITVSDEMLNELVNLKR